MATQKKTPIKAPKATKAAKAPGAAKAPSPAKGAKGAAASALASVATSTSVEQADELLDVAEPIDAVLTVDAPDEPADDDDEADLDEDADLGEAADGDDELPLPKLRVPVAPKPPPPPRRETGPATLGVTADGSTPWTVRAGQNARLKLTIVNTGGPARGIWVELGGQAMTGGHVAGVKASSGEVAIVPARPDGASATPRAVLASVNLDGAEIRDTKDKLPPGPRPTATVEVEVRGLTKGKALFTVRVGVMTPRGPASSGSALCGRALDVTE